MLFWACAACVALYLLWEKTALRRCLKAVPLRIHVYGTRGKSGLTRMVAALLRQNGIKTMGRTTGDAPLLHHPDGTEERQRRLGSANIHEYLGCLRKARASGCKALVMECMALSPENICAAGNMLRPGRVLLTNTRPDHYESQGPTDEDIVRALSLSMSPGAEVLARADAGAALLRQRAEQNGNTLVLLEEKGLPLAPNQENALLAARLAQDLGLEAPQPLKPEWPRFQRVFTRRPAPKEPPEGIRKAQPGESFLFLDLFSANDLHSSTLLLQHALQELGGSSALPLIALLATRPDRPLRTKAFADWLGRGKNFLFCCPQGGHAPYARMRLRSLGVRLLPFSLWSFLRRPWSTEPGRLVSAIRRQLGPAPASGCPEQGFPENIRPQNILPESDSPARAGGMAPTDKKGSDQYSGEFLLVGLGNAHGYGERFRAWVKERA